MNEGNMLFKEFSRSGFIFKLWNRGLTRSNVCSVLYLAVCATDGQKNFTALRKSRHLLCAVVTLTTISTDSPPYLFWTIMVYLPESSKETPLIVRLANLPWSRETTYWNMKSKVRRASELTQELKQWFKIWNAWHLELSLILWPEQQLELCFFSKYRALLWGIYVHEA